MGHRVQWFWPASLMLLLAGLTGCERNSGTPRDGERDVSRAPAAAIPGFDESKQSRALSTGITMTFVEAGDPDGEPVILLHGYTDTSRSFSRVLEDLVVGGAPLRLIALDQRGHGGSSMPPASRCAEAPERCFDPATMAEDVIALMDVLGLASGHVVGHSMGSLVAQELALTHPSRVRSLMLIGAFVSGDTPTFTDFLVPLIEGTDASEGQWLSLIHISEPTRPY